MEVLGFKLNKWDIGNLLAKLKTTEISYGRARLHCYAKFIIHLFLKFPTWLIESIGASPFCKFIGDFYLPTMARSRVMYVCTEVIFILHDQ